MSRFVKSSIYSALLLAISVSALPSSFVVKSDGNFRSTALPSSVVVEGDGDFRSTALAIHNLYRLDNHARPLVLDPELNKLAHNHAERLARSNSNLLSPSSNLVSPSSNLLSPSSKQLSPSNSGFRENIWSHEGELLPLAKDCEYAIKNWYTGSKAPGKVHSIVDPNVLRSNSITNVGFGVGTKETNGQGYTVVVAFYS